MGSPVGVSSRFASFVGGDDGALDELGNAVGMHVGLKCGEQDGVSCVGSSVVFSIGAFVGLLEGFLV